MALNYLCSNAFIHFFEIENSNWNCHKSGMYGAHTCFGLFLRMTDYCWSENSFIKVKLKKVIEFLLLLWKMPF